MKIMNRVRSKRVSSRIIATVAPLLLPILSFDGSFSGVVLAAEKGDPVTSAANTQAETTPLIPASRVAADMRAPDGFHVGVFAAEPQVRQPIAMAFDGRGRVWVAENYTYAERPVNFDLKYHDRILVLEDTNHDGNADRRTVFWDGAQRLTSVEVGFGGVWALCPPNLLFIPDHDGDDVPDGKPIVVLDGWDASDARHNFVNGLRWGPDGWLYGRHGLLATSHVGRPGCSESERQAINCGIWRYHPLDKRFEVVCQGTTNPWGSDWNEHGEMFFINTVIGHLWHVIPGAHFERMYGEDLNPLAYELIPQTADHFHWDRDREKWSDIRNAAMTNESDRRGGGHAHSGLMIYQGDNWPERYRGDVFTVNFHGQRVNRDHLERHGATYIGKHRPDILQVEDPWFRGLELTYGPDGSVYLLDWSDIGECHENDGVHRTSGRIYRIWHGDSPRSSQPNMARASATDLVAMQQHRNAWFARQAQLELQRRAGRGDKLPTAMRQLRELFHSADMTTHKLRALWCLHATGHASPEWLVELLAHDDEHVRVWAVRLLVDQPPARAEAVPVETAPVEVADALTKLARTESSGLVLTYLASALQRLPHTRRWRLAEQLVQRRVLADDPVFPLMVWYGVEPIVVGSPARSAELISVCRIPRVARLVARRLAGGLHENPRAADPLVKLAATKSERPRRQAIVEGLALGLRGWQRAPRPADWAKLEARVAADDSVATSNLIRELSVVFGDGRAVKELRGLATDSTQGLDSRKSAIRALAVARVTDLPELLDRLLTDRDLGEAAVRAVGSDSRPETTSRLLQKYSAMRPPARTAVVEVLASRPRTASILLDAVAKGTIDRGQVSPFVIRQIQLLGNQQLSKKVSVLWPEMQQVDKNNLERIAAYRKDLSAKSLAGAKLIEGRQLFTKVCGKCHKLFGEGGAIGPELTGAQRSNLTYWLDNVLTPSAQVATNYRMSVVVLDDGRVLNGVLGTETGRTVTLQTPQDKLTLDRATIDEVRRSTLSLMPDGLLANLKPEEVRQLFAYLMAAAPPR